MENITLGQIGLAVTFIVGLITGIIFLVNKIKAFLQNMFKDQLRGLEGKIDKLSSRVDEIDMNSCKNFLVARITELKAGETLDEVAVERFYEQYEHYLKKGGNSYVKNEVEKLKNKGKL